jgi:hypothetical protein
MPVNALTVDFDPGWLSTLSCEACQPINPSTGRNAALARDQVAAGSR